MSGSDKMNLEAADGSTQSSGKTRTGETANGFATAAQLTQIAQLSQGQVSYLVNI